MFIEDFDLKTIDTMYAFREAHISEVLESIMDFRSEHATPEKPYVQWKLEHPTDNIRCITFSGKLRAKEKHSAFRIDSASGSANLQLQIFNGSFIVTSSKGDEITYAFDRKNGPTLSFAQDIRRQNLRKVISNPPSWLIEKVPFFNDKAPAYADFPDFSKIGYCGLTALLNKDATGFSIDAKVITDQTHLEAFRRGWVHLATNGNVDIFDRAEPATHKEVTTPVLDGDYVPLLSTIKNCNALVLAMMTVGKTLPANPAEEFTDLQPFHTSTSTEGGIGLVRKSLYLPLWRSALQASSAPQAIVANIVVEPYNVWLNRGRAFNMVPKSVEVGAEFTSYDPAATNVSALVRCFAYLNAWHKGSKSIAPGGIIVNMLSTGPTMLGHATNSFCHARFECNSVAGQYDKIRFDGGVLTAHGFGSLSAESLLAYMSDSGYVVFFPWLVDRNLIIKENAVCLSDTAATAGFDTMKVKDGQDAPPKAREIYTQAFNFIGSDYKNSVVDALTKLDLSIRLPNTFVEFKTPYANRVFALCFIVTPTKPTAMSD